MLFDINTAVHNQKKNAKRLYAAGFYTGLSLVYTDHANRSA